MRYVKIDVEIIIDKGENFMRNDLMVDTEEYLVTFTYENGETEHLYVIGVFTAKNGQDYIALMTVERETVEVLVYRYIENEDGEFSIENIDDDAELEMASDFIDELLNPKELDYFDDLEE